MKLHLLGDETPQVGLNCNVVLVVIVETPVVHALINRPKATGLFMPAHVNHTDIAEVKTHAGLGCPTTITVEVGNTQFINPNDKVLGGTSRVVSHTNEHYPYLAQRRITHHIDMIASVIGVFLLIPLGIGNFGVTCHLGGVSVFLDSSEHIKVEVEHILIGPDRKSIGRTVSTIMSWGSNYQRNLIFIIVVLDIRTHAHKERYVTILEICSIVNESLMVNEHLQPLVSSKVKISVAVNATCITRLKSIDLHLH